MTSRKRRRRRRGRRLRHRRRWFLCRDPHHSLGGRLERLHSIGKLPDVWRDSLHRVQHGALSLDVCLLPSNEVDLSHAAHDLLHLAIQRIHLLQQRGQSVDVLLLRLPETRLHRANGLLDGLGSIHDLGLLCFGRLRAPVLHLADEHCEV